MPARRGSGRKPLPTQFKILTGNPGKQKLPKNEPVPPDGGLPSPPVHLDSYGTEEWNRVAEGLYVMGVLSTIDQQSLAAYCGSYSRWRHAEEELKKLAENGEINSLIIKNKQGNFVQQPLISIATRAASDMLRYAAEFGLTPSARARMALEPRKKESKFGDW